MTMEEVLAENQRLRDEIYQKYQELNENEKKLVNFFLDKKYTYAYTDKDKITLNYYTQKIVDYDKLQRLYPQVYRDGIIEVFSMEEANKYSSKELNGAILRDCMVHNPIYVLKYERNKVKK